MNRALPNITKRYLTINRFITSLPLEFRNSPLKKHVEIVQVSLFIDDMEIDDRLETFHQPKFISFHGNFVQEWRDLDCYVQMANTDYSKRKKYEMLTSQDSIELWFTDINGEKLDKNNLILNKDGFYHQTIPGPVGGQDRIRRFKFIVELLLHY